MRHFIVLAALSATPAALAADPMVDTITPENALDAAPAAWLGETPHLVIMGTVNGYVFDLQYPDLTQANVHALEVKREYLIDGDARPYQEIDFGLQAVIDGVAKNIEGKLNHADFLTQTLPATLTLQDEENPAGAQTFHEFEFEWEADGISVNEEFGDWTGTAVIHRDTAFDSAAPTGDGVAAGYIAAARGDDTLVISYTFPVTEVEVED